MFSIFNLQFSIYEIYDLTISYTWESQFPRVGKPIPTCRKSGSHVWEFLDSLQLGLSGKEMMSTGQAERLLLHYKTPANS